MTTAPARAPEGIPGWQDISSAPKDGRPILVYVEDNALCREWYYRDRDPMKLIGIASWTDHNGGGWVSYHPGQPTHWMPLPLPPGSIPAPSGDKK